MRLNNNVSKEEKLKSLKEENRKKLQLLLTNFKKLNKKKQLNFIFCLKIK